MILSFLAAPIPPVPAEHCMMKLQCSAETVNRDLVALNMRPGHGKRAKCTIALGREPKGNGYFLLHFTAAHRTGVRYKLVGNVKQIFVRCLSDGKATIRFKEPPHDFCIQSEPLQLKCFLKLLKAILTGDTQTLKLENVSNISVTGKDAAPTTLTIRERADYPPRGLPRTIETLIISGIGLYNFRREILMCRLLKKLDLSNNNLEKLPADLGHMPCLRELHLANNKFGVNSQVDWTWLVGPELSKKLQFLDLSGNKLSQITKSIWKLESLITLRLDNNVLTSLPASLGRIKTLRFLTVCSNELRSLPCSLMQSTIQSVDLSSNKFHETEDKFTLNNHSMWDLYVGDLVRLAGSVVLKHKMNYANNIIPYTLVEFLDNSCYCVCGAPILDKSVYRCKKFELKDFFPVVVFDNNRDQAVHFDCYFCSSRCFNNVVR